MVRPVGSGEYVGAYSPPADVRAPGGDGPPDGFETAQSWGEWVSDKVMQIWLSICGFFASLYASIFGSQNPEVLTTPTDGLIEELERTGDIGSVREKIGVLKRKIEALQQNQSGNLQALCILAGAARRLALTNHKINGIVESQNVPDGQREQFVTAYTKWGVIHALRGLIENDITIITRSVRAENRQLLIQVMNEGEGLIAAEPEMPPEIVAIWNQVKQNCRNFLRSH